MQEIGDTLFAMIVSTSVVVLLSILFISLIYRHLKYKAIHKKELFESIYIAQEEERNKIAMDLHDALGGQLITLKLNLENAKEANNDSVYRKCVIDSISQVKEAIKITRLTSQTLMPATLKRYGLNSAIKELISKFEHSLSVNFEHEIDQPIHHFLELNIYRIISELLTNTIKHSSASTIILRITMEGNIINIVYCDNGSGFDFYSANNLSKGIGLNNIRNRVGFLKGEISFESKSGSCFKILIPIQ